MPHFCRTGPRDGPGFTVEDLTKRLNTDPKPFGQCLAALGLSWRKRADAGHVLDVPALDLGIAKLLLLPGESYVEYQLLAQEQAHDLFVCAIGYGECATGYVPTDQAIREGDECDRARRDLLSAVRHEMHALDLAVRETLRQVQVESARRLGVLGRADMRPPIENY